MHCTNLGELANRLANTDKGVVSEYSNAFEENQDALVCVIFTDQNHQLQRPPCKLRLTWQPAQVAAFLMAFQMSSARPRASIDLSIAWRSRVMRGLGRGEVAAAAWTRGPRASNGSTDEIRILAIEIGMTTPRVVDEMLECTSNRGSCLFILHGDSRQHTILQNLVREVQSAPRLAWLLRHDSVSEGPRWKT